MFPLLTVIILLPLAGAIACALVPKERASAARWVALGVTAIDLLLALVLLASFDAGAGMQFVEKHAWVPQVGIQYYLGVDGISLSMLVLSALLSVLAVVASW